MSSIDNKGKIVIITYYTRLLALVEAKKVYNCLLDGSKTQLNFNYLFKDRFLKSSYEGNLLEILKSLGDKDIPQRKIVSLT